MGVGDTAAPLRFPLQLAKHKRLRSRGLEEARYGPGTPGDRGEWEHGQRIDTHGPGLRRVKEARDGLTKDESLVI